MNYNTMLLIIMILSLLYNLMIIISEVKKKKNDSNNIIYKCEIKKWENNTTLIVDLIMFGFLIFLLLKVKPFSYIYSFLYYLFLLLMYGAVLVKILIKKENEKITEDELGYLVSIPGIFSILYNMKISQTFLKLLQDRYGATIVFFILKNITKYFIVIFFLTIIIFLILLKFNNMGTIKLKYKLRYADFDTSKYIYINSRGKKGKKFIMGYFKDIAILIKGIIVSAFYNYILAPIIFTYKVFIKFLKKLTKDFSVYVIIIKTFNISLIISLITTYYKLLCNYNGDVLTELYAVIITTIIIPIILNIISDLKETKQ